MKLVDNSTNVSVPEQAFAMVDNHSLLRSKSFRSRYVGRSEQRAGSYNVEKVFMRPADFSAMK